MTTGNKLQLPDVAIYTYCWGTAHVKKSLRTMLISMDQVDFKRAVLITDPSRTDMEKISPILDKYNIEVCEMRSDLNENMLDDDENRFGFRDDFLRDVKHYMTDDFCLNVQHDSCVINADKWDKRFLESDYIGAPWPMQIIQSSDMVAGRIPTDQIPTTVGNGGFSLRSRKFVENSVGLESHHKNEDLNICIFNYHHLASRGVKIADEALAAKFSFERSTNRTPHAKPRLFFTYGTFGFHGDFNTAGMEWIRNYKLGVDV
jgi:hypothetical protein